MMNLILYIGLQTLSVGFALLVLWRLYRYIKKYQFDESKYTLLFGFVHLHWIAITYFILVALWIPVSFLYLRIL